MFGDFMSCQNKTIISIRSVANTGKWHYAVQSLPNDGKHHNLLRDNRLVYCVLHKGSIDESHPAATLRAIERKHATETAEWSTLQSALAHCCCRGFLEDSVLKYSCWLRRIYLDSRCLLFSNMNLGHSHESFHHELLSFRSMTLYTCTLSWTVELLEWKRASFQKAKNCDTYLPALWVHQVCCYWKCTWNDAWRRDWRIGTEWGGVRRCSAYRSIHRIYTKGDLDQRSKWDFSRLRVHLKPP